MADAEENKVKNGSYTLVSQQDGDDPPSYETASCSQAPSTQEESSNSNEFELNQKLPEKLPSYESATTLPTYEDFQEIKKDEARREAIEMFFGNADQDEMYVDGVAVGTDCMFIFSFVFSFFFNWIGFFVGYCILMNLAGRYGAMTGLGLSFLNALFFMKYSNDDFHLRGERVLVWWFFVFIALFLTLKGLINWFKARKLLFLSPEQRQNGRVVVLY